jgi:AraC-like DNA-binding protein
MVHQVNLFLLLFGALQGVMLSLWLFRNKQKKISNLYLSFFLSVVGLQLTFKVITKTWVMDHALIPYVLSYKLPYLIGPLLFLFVRSQKEEKWKLFDILHFIPFVFFTALYFLWSGPQFHPYAQAAFQAISLGVYTLFSFRLSNDLIKQFIAFVASAEFIIILTLAVMYMYYGRFPDVRLLFITLTILIYWISYKVLSGSNLFFQVDAPVMSLQSQKNSKYAHSSLKPEEADRIENELAATMRDAKLFVDPSLTIDSLALKFQTSRHHLSQVLNERLQKTYADYIGSLRLEEARRRLSDPGNLRYTIAGIAMDSGFNSVSTFNEAFKRQFHQTPSRYREQVLKEKSA